MLVTLDRVSWSARCAEIGFFNFVCIVLVGFKNCCVVIVWNWLLVDFTLE